MYIVMLILRFVLSMQGGCFRDLRWVPIHTQTPPGYHQSSHGSARWCVGSGHVSICPVVRSPLPSRRRVNRPPVGLCGRHGPASRLQLM